MANEVKVESVKEIRPEDKRTRDTLEFLQSISRRLKNAETREPNTVQEVVREIDEEIRKTGNKVASDTRTTR